MKNFNLLFLASLLFDGLCLNLSSSIGLPIPIVSTVLIAINTFVFAAIITKVEENRGAYFFIFVAFIIKILLIYFDIYGRNIFILPNSGADSESFWRAAIDGRAFGELSAFTKVLRIETYIFGENRIMLQYVNSIFGTLSQIALIQIMDLLNINRNTIYKSSMLIALLPNTLVICSILLRESLIIWLMSISFYYLVKWYKNRRSGLLFYLSLIPIILSAALHSSMMFAIIPYIFLFIFSSKTENDFRLHFNRTTITKFAIISVLLTIIFSLFASTLFTYFQGMDNFDDISTKMSNYSTGGASYLSFIANTKNPLVVLVTAPIKLLYLYVSPMPWDWRGINDLVAFSLSSIVFFVVILRLIKINDKTQIVLFVVFTLIFMGAVYGMSTFNSGTAIRHREKMYPFLAIAIPFIINERQKINRKEDL